MNRIPIHIGYDYSAGLSVDNLVKGRDHAAALYDV